MKAATFIACTLFAGAASAIRFPVRSASLGVHAGGVNSNKPVGLFGSEEDDGEIDVDNHQDTLYTSVVSLGGKEYRIVLDTGSSDLWVYAPDDPPTTTKTTKYEAGVKYGKGEISGFIDFADFEFGDYKVPSQAFINVDKTADLDEIFAMDIYGILGLSFDGSSKVDAAVRKGEGKETTEGRTPLSNIFHQNPEQDNFISVLLGRTGDEDDEVEGEFTISEYIEEYKDVQNQPKLYRQKVDVKGALTRWNVEVDGMSVNGKALPLKSEFKGVKEGKVIAMIDTGYSFPPVDTYIADAIYSSVPGAVKAKEGNTWIVPCLNTAEVVLKLGGKDFPIHPLDLSYPTIAEGSDGNEYTYCMNTFQAHDNLGDMDMILGAAFLKNTYAVFDWGKETDGSTEEPFIQLLATTHFDEAVPEFLHARAETLKSLPKELEPAALLTALGIEATAHSNTGNSTGTTTTTTSNEGNSKSNTKENTKGNINNLSAAGEDDDSKFDDLINKVGGYGPIIIGLLGANLVFALILTGIGIYVCLRRRGTPGKSVGASYAPVKLKDSDNHSGYSGYRDNVPYNA